MQITLQPGLSEDSHNFNQMTVFNGKATVTDQLRGIDTKRPSSKPAQTGITISTQTSPKKISQTGGTQTTPPPSPRRSTLTGETQTIPPQNNIHDQRVQGQLDHNHISKDPLANNTGSNTSKGKKNRKKLTHEVPP